ncbi:MAG TPA: hypothetical protein VKF36_22110 [Syntrophorhabdales bacterium]|nr:hypothetical protein [Syntrophorhabdales bacterium]
MGSKERPTILDRLLEMLRGRGGIAKDRPDVGSRKTERDRSKTARKAGKKRKRAAPAC